MPRPVKWRRVEFIPQVQNFIPTGVKSESIEENILQVEELEAIRLKDAKGLMQEECAGKMQISRQTFQRILNSGRRKIADSLVNGKSIRIEGGNFTRNICLVMCNNCGHRWDESYENFQRVLAGEFVCPECGSKRINCAASKNKQFCRRNCWRHGSSKRL